MPPEPLRYRIKLHKDVLDEDSKKFDARTKEKIKQKCLELLSRHPEEVGEPLRPPLGRYRKLVIFNNYRIVCRVDRDEVVVFILAVGIRRDAEVYELALRRLKKEGFWKAQGA
jgi:mRNA interferase RelE/StbE